MDAREELYALLDNETRETVEALRTKIVEGTFVGGCYYDSEIGCGCLYGTLALLHGCNTEADVWQEVGRIARAIDVSIVEIGNSFSPLESFVMGIFIYDTVDESPRTKELLGWIDTYLEAHRETE